VFFNTSVGQGHFEINVNVLEVPPTEIIKGKKSNLEVLWWTGNINNTLSFYTRTAELKTV